jgi:hypothetical protein
LFSPLSLTLAYHWPLFKHRGSEVLAMEAWPSWLTSTKGFRVARLPLPLSFPNVTVATKELGYLAVKLESSFI